MQELVSVSRLILSPQNSATTFPRCQAASYSSTNHSLEAAEVRDGEKTHLDFSLHPKQWIGGDEIL